MSILKIPTIYTVRKVKALTAELNRLNSAYNAKVSENIEFKLQNESLMCENAAMKQKILEQQALLDAKEVAICKRESRIHSLHLRLTKLENDYRAFRSDVLRSILPGEDQ